MSRLNYVKNNKVRFKSSKHREEGVRAFNKFFQDLQSGHEMQGHAVLESMSDPQEAIVLTFWQTKDAMHKFYLPDNTVLSDLVERVKPLFEKMPDRTDYKVSELELVQ